ncbi:MAG: hypothetical protein JNM57_11640 [Cyclobacteriaceae bacterium]|nr:hypothetical protein [Cyclobacteriaceae bacterium]
MKLIRTILFLTTCAHLCLAQEISELDKKNGFKDIKLGMIADSIKGVKLKKEFKEKDEFAAKLFIVEHIDYTKIGEVKVDKIELKAYKDMVYEISVVTQKDPRLMKALESLYGKADYDLKAETYFWKSENMILKFRAHGKHHLELLYQSYLLHRMMKADKNQKVDDIANDF